MGVAIPAAQPPLAHSRQEFVWEASHYLVRQVFKSLQEMFSGTRAIQVRPGPPLPGVASWTGLVLSLSPPCSAGWPRAPGSLPAPAPLWSGSHPWASPSSSLTTMTPRCWYVRPHPRPPHPTRPGAGLTPPAFPPTTLQISGGIQSLTFSNSGDTSQ